MTKADELNVLADRCEREEASRELDDAIWETIEGRLSYTLGHPFKSGNPPRRTRLPIPTYTTSLDAAVTLVPENFSFELAFSAAGKGAMRRARLWDWRRGPLMVDPANEWASTAKSLPLAICAAALRARALSQTDGAEPTPPKVRTKE